MLLLLKLTCSCVSSNNSGNVTLSEGETSHNIEIGGYFRDVPHSYWHLIIWAGTEETESNTTKPDMHK